jgi:hypothetical protein
MVYGHPKNADLIYVGAGTQVFVRTTAGGNLAPTPGAFPGGMVFGAAVDPANENTVYAIGNAKVFQSVDGGATWTDITGNITADGAGTFRSIVYIPNGTNDRIAVGTNAGVLVSCESSLGTWFQLGSGLPHAPVWDLAYDAADDVLVAGTLGRGAWTLSAITASPNMLWPPNHKMVHVAVTLSAIDVCDTATPSCQIISVTSNEPVDGQGDGNTSPDWIITGPLTVDLRAERSGTGAGRIYTITVQCTNHSGNSSTATVTVTVPHFRR